MVVTVVCLFGVSAVQAQNNVFLPASGNYDVAGNWSLGNVPISGENPLLVYGGTIVLNTAVVPAPSYFFVGESLSIGTATFDVQTGGSLLVGEIDIARDGTGTGVVTQSGGAISTALDIRVGNDQDGSNEAEGFYNLSGGTVSVGGTLWVGERSKGTLAMTGGTINTVDLIVGYFPTSGTSVATASSASVSSGTVITSGSNFVVGHSAVGILTVNGGTVNVSSGSGVQIALTSTASDARLNISSGAFNSSTFINVGNDGYANTQAQLNVTGGSLTWGNVGNTGALSVYGDMTVSGSVGTLLTGTGTLAGLFNVHSEGSLRFNLNSDGTVPLIDIANATMGIQTGSQLIIDGTGLSLGAGLYSFTLIDHNGYATVGEGFGGAMTTSFVGFDLGLYTPTIDFGAGAVTLNIAAVPEPSSCVLLAVGLTALTVLRRRSLRKA